MADLPNHDIDTVFAQKRGTVVLKVRAVTLNHFPFHNVPGLGGSAGDSYCVKAVTGGRLDSIGIIRTELFDIPEKVLN